MSRAPSPVTLDLHLDRTGGSGTVSSKGLAFQVTRIGNAAYFTGTQAFYRHFTNAAGVALLERQVAEGARDRTAASPRSAG